MATEPAESSTAMQGKTFVWHEIYAPDNQKTIDFYTEALGFGTAEMEMGEMGKYQMLTRDGTPVAGIFSTSKPGMENVPSHWSTYLSVDDVDARLEKCVSLGATVLMQPMDVPTVGRMALIHDPQGATIWLFKGTG